MANYIPKNLSNKRKSYHLALIGMSGIGKSYWSKKMEDKGYRRYSCDDLIAYKLSLKLDKDVNSTLDLANWMGKPYSKGYKEAEALYLEMEEEVTNFICDELENPYSKNEPVVVDTTGSIIYLNNSLLNRLRNLVRIVHLNMPAQNHEELFKGYLIDPKPLIWNGKYLPNEEESRQKSLRRCYSELISFRNKSYKFISDCELDYSFHHSPRAEVNDFLEMVKNSLK